MTTGHVFIATSLDGFIARKDGGIDWLLQLDSQGVDYGYDDFYAGMDGMLLGRNSYEMALTFDAWPYTKPVLVLSRTMRRDDLPPDLGGRVEIINTSPAGAMAEAASRGWKRVYVDGGALIQSCLRDGLISDMVVSRIPVLIGEGLPLFGAVPQDIWLHHDKTTSYPSGLVQSRYLVKAAA
jgi:dihydrofolate reductase